MESEIGGVSAIYQISPGTNFVFVSFTPVQEIGTPSTCPGVSWLQHVAASSLAAVSSRPNINYLKEKFSDRIIINDAVRELNKESAKTSVNKIYVLDH